MLKHDFIAALKIISQKLSAENVKWALLASANMAAQGMQINPYDLDIIVMLESLAVIKRTFSEFSPSSIKRLRPMGQETVEEIAFTINGVRVDMFCEGTRGIYGSKLVAGEIIIVNVNNLNIPCFNLRAEAQAYAETNHEQKAKMILKYLEDNNK